MVLIAQWRCQHMTLTEIMALVLRLTSAYIVYHMLFRLSRVSGPLRKYRPTYNSFISLSKYSPQLLSGKPSNRISTQGKSENSSPI